jgi:tetratricopeptide (TPR) repeat protein
LLEKAIDLRPKLAAPETTTGYARFCLASIVGLLALQRGVTAVERARLINSALLELKEAEANQHQPSYQFHLKAALFMTLGKAQEAADAWYEAAQRWKPSSAKMYFNRACALAKLEKYDEALTDLEVASEIYDQKKEAEMKLGLSAEGGLPHFNPRTQAFDKDEGEEFKPFRDQDPKAAEAKSRNGKTFQQIVNPRP